MSCLIWKIKPPHIQCPAMPARQQVFDSKLFIAYLCQGNNLSSIRIGFFLSCFPFPDFFVKSAEMPTYPILTYIANNWACVPAVLSPKWIIVASPQWPGKTESFLPGSVSWIPHLLLSWHQLHILCLSEKRKTRSRKRLSFKFCSLPGQTWEQVKHNSESSSLLNSREEKKISSSIFFKKQNKDAR